VLRLVVREVLDDAKDIAREDVGVQRHGVEVRLQILKREGEVRDVHVVGLGGSLFRQKQRGGGRARASYRE